MTQMEAVVDLLRKKGRVSIDDMENTLQIEKHQIQVLISIINRKNTGKWSAIQIHRTGKKGNSSYELQDGQTDDSVFFKTMRRLSNGTIKAVRNYRKIGNIAMVETLEREERARISAQLENDKSQLAHQIANAIR